MKVDRSYNDFEQDRIIFGFYSKKYITLQNQCNKKKIYLKILIFL